MDWYRLRPDPHGPFTDPATGKRLGTYARPFMSTPSATGALVAVLIEDQPDGTIAEIRERVIYDLELTQILDQHVADGWGHLRAADVFAH